mgnify:CR=1 FL=1
MQVPFPRMVYDNGSQTTPFLALSGMAARAFDIRRPNLVLGLFRDVVSSNLPPYWLIGGDNCIDWAVRSGFTSM